MLDTVKNVASDVPRPGRGSPGESWLGGLVPAAAAVDPEPSFTFAVEVQNKLNLKPDFTGGLRNRTVGRGDSWPSGDLGTSGESLFPLYPGSWDLPQV